MPPKTQKLPTAKKHWKVITFNEWPAIQMNSQETPFITFRNDTVLGERAAHRWAETICAWMNEQMRLGLTTNKPKNCDAMMLVRLREAEAKITKLHLENQELQSRLIKLNQTYGQAAYVLRQFR